MIRKPSEFTTNGNIPYHTVGGAEWYGGTAGILGIQISLAVSQPVDLDHYDIRNVIDDAKDMIYDEIIARTIAEDPKSAERAEKEKAELIACFPCEVVADPIKNQYWTNQSTGRTDPHFRHLPWFLVTARDYGVFKIGWRKRVISIEWDGVPHGPHANDLFPDEDVTKWEYGIHAWTRDKAKEYLAVLFKHLKEKRDQFNQIPL